MAFNTAHFARMPESKKPHTLMKRPGVHAGTMLHSKIVPAYCKLLSPGEVINEHIVGNIRMSTPIAPLYSSIKISFNAFFIPLRLVWEHTKEFFGENTTAAGPQQVQYKIPKRSINIVSDSSDQVKVGSVSHYLGKPLYKGSTIDSGTYNNGNTASILKERAYWITISEWYRHEQVQNPVILNKTDTPLIGSLNGSPLSVSSDCASCLKDFDYFTTMTRSPQYGPDVTLPLGSVAPVVAASSLHSTVNNVKFTASGLSDTVSGDLGAGNGVFGFLTTGGSLTSGGEIDRTNLVTDLSNATATTIDELYLSMAAQAWYHAANYGSKYFEALQIHYGVYNPDLVMQRPEHCGEAKRYIQVQQVLSTAGATGDSTTKLGQPGANSSTNLDIKFPRYAAGEWGYYMILMNTYHERYYPAGVLREDLYEDMFDFYFPEFANIGDQGVFESEIFFSSGSTDPDKLLGFQEAWAEMRYTPNRLSGLLDPYAQLGVNSSANALAQWTLGEKWANAPTLSSQFLTEDRDAIANALVTGSAGPDYIFYLYFDEKTLSEVPLFSVPGLPGRGRGIL